MAEGTHLIRTIRAALLASLVGAWGAASGLAQDPVPPDSALEVLSDSARAVFGDTTPPAAQRFPARLLPLRGPTHEVYTCERECLHASSAFSLIELLLEEVPGLMAVRAGYFAGPHHALDGALGPGFTQLFIDGREVLSLARRQVDLRRLSLNYVERVRVFRGADGFVLDVDLIRHDAARAYSRISGGTGDPQAQVLDGIFANGLGRSFNVEGAFELLDVNAGFVENDRFGAFGRLSWIPGSNRFGVQLELRADAVDRSAADTADLRRRELTLRARADVGSSAQLEAFATTATWSQALPGASMTDGPARSVDMVGLRASATPGAGAVTAGIRLAGGPSVASWLADVTAWMPLGPLWLEGGAELASWNDFSTRMLRAGLAYSDSSVFPLTARVFAASGDRGLGLPEMATADSLGFAQLGASLDVDVGPFWFSGRYALQELDRPFGFGGFDGLAVLDSTEVDVASWEVRFEGPILPVGGIFPGLDPIRLRGFWRQNRSTGAQALFVPESLARAELALHDTFFDGNLRIWLSGFLERRGQRLVAVSGSPDPVLAAADSWPGGQFMFMIGDFRFFWRFTNPATLVVSDIPGADFPARVNVFGIRWEFFN